MTSYTKNDRRYEYAYNSDGMRTLKKVYENGEGLLHRAYMMSALRSFAWTLSDYCQKSNCTPEDVSVDDLSELVKFISAAEWLNYDGITYCKGLCSGQDFHVYFVPDGISQADKKRLLPSDEDYNRINELFETEIIREIRLKNDENAKFCTT